MNGEGERRLLGVLDDNTGLTDVLGDNIFVFCSLRKSKVVKTCQI